MATYDVTCAGCSAAFVAQSPRAKWCSPGCKKAQQRKGSEPVEPPAEKPTIDVERHGLVVSVTRELTEAKVLETAAGQQALQLARRLAIPDESGVSGLSKELSRVLAEAKATSAVPTPAAAAEDDQLAKARKARERKARNAQARRA